METEKCTSGLLFYMNLNEKLQSRSCATRGQHAQRVLMFTTYFYIKPLLLIILPQTIVNV